ncbi:MAG: bifunctional 4-hydroxy-2-oxoglutarate aldolase/2-dehydro-3-deoxy-phosphogluconate aldolase [Eubacteriales bacterium]
MNSILAQLSEIAIIPVIALHDENHAVPLAKALIAGGIPAAEVTFRTEAAEGAIRAMVENCPDILVGAGTILNVEQCHRAIDAGAKFIVSPGYNQEVVDCCIAQNMPILPGCTNPSDMTRAVNSGLEVVKFFPAEVSGGLNYIKNVAPVFPGLKFMPTGGISPANVATYLAYDRIVACGGSWMVKSDMIAGEKFEEITTMCREAASLVKRG